MKRPFNEEADPIWVGSPSERKLKETGSKNKKISSDHKYIYFKNILFLKQRGYSFG